VEPASVKGRYAELMATRAVTPFAFPPRLRDYHDAVNCSPTFLTLTQFRAGG
jgi:hypothetical protein